MTAIPALRRTLVLSWLAGALVLGAMFYWADTDYAWWIYAAGAALAWALEGPVMGPVYTVAPTPHVYFRQHPVWKTFAVVWGMAMAVLALALLTVAQPWAHWLSAHLWLVFAVLLGPWLVPLVAHQAAVYRALGAVAPK